MEDLLESLGDHVSTQELGEWKLILSFVAPVENLNEWEMALERSTSAGDLLLHLSAEGYITGTDPRLLIKLLESLGERRDGLVRRVNNHWRAQEKRGVHPREADPLDDLMRRIAFEERLGAGWRQFALGRRGLGLQLLLEDVEEIEHMNRQKGQSLADMAYEAMRIWRDRNGPEATETVLLDSLHKSGQRRIADRIRKTMRTDS